MSGSNSTSTLPSFETPVPTPTVSISSPANPGEPTTVTTTDPVIPSISFPPTTESVTTPPPPETTTSSDPPTTTSTTSSEITSTTSSIPSTSSAPTVITSVITQTPTDSGLPPTTIVITSTAPSTPEPTTRSSSSTSSRTSSTAGLNTPTAAASGGGLNGGGKIAVAVVVPIVAVALLILGGLFLWRKRKQRKDAEELRRKEVEEYGYNPNNDPSLPVGGAVGGGASDGAYEMREDGSSGYRGWGTTAVASTGRKASTTMSGPSANGNNIGMAYSDPSPSHDARSDNPLVDGRSASPEPETLGALGPAASQNRNGDIHRGPSNASSSYSAANRSDGSGDISGLGGGGYNNQYDTGNPYTETPYGSPPNRAEMSGQPVIRDVSARRNTRIENPSHFPQQSAGISQNF